MREENEAKEMKTRKNVDKNMSEKRGKENERKMREYEYWRINIKSVWNLNFEIENLAPLIGFRVNQNLAYSWHVMELTFWRAK